MIKIETKMITMKVEMTSVIQELISPTAAKRMKVMPMNIQYRSSF